MNAIRWEELKNDKNTIVKVWFGIAELELLLRNWEIILEHTRKPFTLLDLIKRQLELMNINADFPKGWKAVEYEASISSEQEIQEFKETLIQVAKAEEHERDSSLYSTLHN